MSLSMDGGARRRAPSLSVVKSSSLTTLPLPLHPPTPRSSSFGKLLAYIENANLKKIKSKLASKKAKTLLSTRDEYGQTPLLFALKQPDPNIDVIEMLMQPYSSSNPPDINLGDIYGYTPLHVVMGLEPKLAQLVLSNDHVRADLANHDLNTPLHYFCQKFRSNSRQAIADMLDVLIKKGAPINGQNVNGETAMHKAVFNSMGALAILEGVIERGGDSAVLNFKGEGALHYAVRLGREDLVLVLLRTPPPRDVLSNLVAMARAANFEQIAAVLSNSGAGEGSGGLQSVLHNPTLRENFATWLTTQHADENLAFWSAVEAFRQLKVEHHRLDTEARKIYNKYCSPKSTSELNLTYNVKEELTATFDTIPGIDAPPPAITINTFDRAQKDIYELMRTSLFETYKRQCLNPTK